MPPKSAKPSIEKIQTLHPVPGKVNKKIAADKYELVKKNILAILAKEEPTHLELMEALYQRIGKTFDGGVQWYGEIVKLDLEARKMIGRTKTKPERYTLTM
jgi:hypothetical protein